jgi:hypothetical protein
MLLDSTSPGSFPGAGWAPTLFCIISLRRLVCDSSPSRRSDWLYGVDDITSLGDVASKRECPARLLVDMDAGALNAVSSALLMGVSPGEPCVCMKTRPLNKLHGPESHRHLDPKSGHRQ